MNKTQLEIIEECVEKLEALTPSEKEKLVKWIRTRPGDLTADLIESYPGVVLRVETQFSGTMWYPKVADGYVDAISNIERITHDYLDHVFEFSSGLCQGLNMTPVNVNAMPAPIEYIGKCFPDMSHTDMDRLADLFYSWDSDSVEPDYEKDEEGFFADAFTVLASTRYCYYVAREASTEELLTFWYPSMRYSESYVQDVIVPEYIKVQKEYENAYDAWRNSR